MNKAKLAQLLIESSELLNEATLYINNLTEKDILKQADFRGGKRGILMAYKRSVLMIIITIFRWDKNIYGKELAEELIVRLNLNGDPKLNRREVEQFITYSIQNLERQKFNKNYLKALRNSMPYINELLNN